MLHDSGIVTIYRVSVDENGPPPKVEKLVKKSAHYFGEMTVGIQRYYAAARIEDRYYLIRQVTPTKDEDGMLVTRLSLEETSTNLWEVST